MGEGHGNVSSRRRVRVTGDGSKKMSRILRHFGNSCPRGFGILGAFAVAILAIGVSAPVHAEGIQQPSVVAPDSPFIEAVRDGDIDQLKAALVRGASMDARDKMGSPALFVSLQFGQHEVFKFLLDNGARVKSKDRAGDTLVTLLAGTRLTHLAALILEAGADPDRLGANREPAIIIATRAGQAEMVRLLLDRDADYDATDLTGRTALAIAEQRRDPVISDMLRAAGAY